jgi:hypothetical protein
MSALAPVLGAARRAGGGCGGSNSLAADDNSSLLANGGLLLAAGVATLVTGKTVLANFVDVHFGYSGSRAPGEPDKYILAYCYRYR